MVKRDYVIIGVAIATFLGLAAFKGLEYRVEYLFLLYFFVALFYELDARFAVGAGLVLLVGAAFAIQRSEAFANQIAIYAYYFLVAGISLELVNYLEERGDEEAEDAQEKKMEKKKNRIIIVTSGKGGVGKTTITANLAVALAWIGKDVVAVDGDIAMPNLDIAMGIKSAPASLRDVINGSLRVKNALYDSFEGVKVLPCSPCLEGLTEDNSKKIKQILQQLKDDFDFVLLDTPPGREAAALMDVDYEIILVVNPDQASVLDALNMEALAEKQDCKILGVVMNMVGALKSELKIDEIEKTLGLEVIAIVPYNKKFKEAFAAEIPFFLYTDPESNASSEITELAIYLTEK